MADLAKKLVTAGIAKLGLVTLGGMLGAGKTTLVKEILGVLGYQGVVKSPTFTLVEPYNFGQYSIMHLDLYRLEDPQEIEFLGYRELFSGDRLVLIEWPEKAHGFLPEPDLNVMIQIQENRRHILLESYTAAGNLLLEQLNA